MTAATPVFAHSFSDHSYWNPGWTSAYPAVLPDGSQANLTNGKMDYICPSWSDPHGNTFSAKLVHGRWEADEVTTERSVHPFELKPGERLTATVTLGGSIGEWDGIWTWAAGGHEVDLFEYHGSKPTTLEFYNHANAKGPRAPGYKSIIKGIVKPGVSFKLDVRFKTTGVEYRVNDRLVFVANTLPANWRAFLVVNESIDNGKWHPRPVSNDTIGMTVNSLEVWSS